MERSSTAASVRPSRAWAVASILGMRAVRSCWLRQARDFNGGARPIPGRLSSRSLPGVRAMRPRGDEIPSPEAAPTASWKRRAGGLGPGPPDHCDVVVLDAIRDLPSTVNDRAPVRSVQWDCLNEGHDHPNERNPLPEPATGPRGISAPLIALVVWADFKFNVHQACAGLEPLARVTRMQSAARDVRPRAGATAMVIARRSVEGRTRLPQTGHLVALIAACGRLLWGTKETLAVELSA